ncbi:MAG TPA: hypothetical protein VN541_05005, partial [Tepidisphaeraceae bacterium]|nr:hypothetical protein [Tepidisphaeraceae bacterium]
MSTISVEEINRDPRDFLRRIEAGEEMLVTRNERPLAEVRPLSQARPDPRPYGLAAGQFAVPTDFDAPLPENIL